MKIMDEQIIMGNNMKMIKVCKNIKIQTYNLKISTFEYVLTDFLEEPMELKFKYK